MTSLRRFFSQLRLTPFIIGGLLYALVYGSCDYNYWGAWILSLRAFLDFPFSALLAFAARHSSNPESSRLAFFDVVAILMNAHLYGFLLSLMVARCTARTKTEPNKALEPTPTSVTDRADARSAPDAGAAHL